MSNEKFITMLERQINLFVATFQNDGESLFKNADNRLIHPGEYGMYRERCFKALLQSVLSREEKVSDGFIITPKDDAISTQCDILVRNANAVPLTDNGIVKFFPVEDVYAIIEVKSNLTKTDFKECLRKLAENKMLSDHRRNNLRLNDLSFAELNVIPSFLVCNKLEFDVKSLKFGEIYAGIERKYWHNAILSLNDGVWSYALRLADLPVKTKQHYLDKKFDVVNGVCVHQYSQHALIFPDGEVEVYLCPHNFVRKKENDRYKHIIFFLCAIKQAVDQMIRYSFDSIVYLGMNEDKLCTDYEKLYDKI